MACSNGTVHTLFVLQHINFVSMKLVLWLQRADLLNPVHGF